MRRLLVAIFVATTLTGCSSSVEVKRKGAVCVAERKSKFIGIPYSTNNNVVNCPRSA